jgi:hypothetical protein
LVCSPGRSSWWARSSPWCGSFRLWCFRCPPRVATKSWSPLKVSKRLGTDRAPSRLRSLTLSPTHPSFALSLLSCNLLRQSTLTTILLCCLCCCCFFTGGFFSSLATLLVMVAIYYGTLFVLQFKYPAARNLLYKSQIFPMGAVVMACSRDFKWKKPVPNPAAIKDLPASAKQVRRIVFIRHGESEWNEVFNRGMKGFASRLLNAIVKVYCLAWLLVCCCSVLLLPYDLLADMRTLSSTHRLCVCTCVCTRVYTRMKLTNNTNCLCVHLQTIGTATADNQR